MNALSEVRDQRSEVRGQRAEVGVRRTDNRGLKTEEGGPPSSVIGRPIAHVAVLTGGADKPYVLGLAEALTLAGVPIDVIGSDDLTVPELLANPRVAFLNLRGDQSSDAGLARKIKRILTYYWRLICYTATGQPKLFHILWNNKFELFDRTFLMLYYKLMGKRVVLTAHNVNRRKRDGTDSWLNRLSLRIQYQLSDHTFVHTDRMKKELVSDFAVSADKVSVIPFGINNTVPNTSITAADARRLLGIAEGDKTILCYGQIAPYKGLEYLVAAFAELLKRDRSYRLIIAGKPKWNQDYWNQIAQLITNRGVQRRVVERIEHVPDKETELYFKAADVLVLSYTEVFQSGVIFLGYSFGLPAIVADVGSLKDEIIEGKTGFVFTAKDSMALAKTIETYFSSDLFKNLENRRQEIRDYASERYSWTKVAAITTMVYSKLLET